MPPNKRCPLLYPFSFFALIRHLVSVFSLVLPHGVMLHICFRCLSSVCTTECGLRGGKELSQFSSMTSSLSYMSPWKV